MKGTHRTTKVRKGTKGRLQEQDQIGASWGTMEINNYGGDHLVVKRIGYDCTQSRLVLCHLESLRGGGCRMGGGCSHQGQDLNCSFVIEK